MQKTAMDILYRRIGNTLTDYLIGSTKIDRNEW